MISVEGIDPSAKEQGKMNWRWGEMNGMVDSN